MKNLLTIGIVAAMIFIAAPVFADDIPAGIPPIAYRWVDDAFVVRDDVNTVMGFFTREVDLDQDGRVDLVQVYHLFEMPDSFQDMIVLYPFPWMIQYDLNGNGRLDLNERWVNMNQSLLKDPEYRRWIPAP